jgi:hypothetical protein
MLHVAVLGFWLYAVSAGKNPRILGWASIAAIPVAFDVLRIAMGIR